MPEPIPRPTRFLLEFAPFGARRFERFFAMISSLNAGPFLKQNRLALPRVRHDGGLLDDANQVRNLLHHAANRRTVLALDNLVQPRKAQALHNELVLHRRADLRTIVLNLDCVGRCHYSSPVAVRNRGATKLALLTRQALTP